MTHTTEAMEVWRKALKASYTDEARQNHQSAAAVIATALAERDARIERLRGALADIAEATNAETMLVKTTADTARERALVEAARAVEVRMLKHNAGLWGSAPGHGHRIAGVWDIDPGNGAKGGTACEWCAQWQEFRAALSQYEEPKQ